MRITVREQANALGEQLRSKSLRVVLAESCTAGHVVAALGAIPGISSFLCGSVVTYRIQSKIDWLGVAPATIQEHSAESGPVAAEMAERVLARTTEADFSAAVTGHLGPNAPRDRSGIVYVAVARRKENRVELCSLEEIRLQAQGRLDRREETTNHVLYQLERWIGA